MRKLEFVAKTVAKLDHMLCSSFTATSENFCGSVFVDFSSITPILEQFICDLFVDLSSILRFWNSSSVISLQICLLYSDFGTVQWISFCRFVIYIPMSEQFSKYLFVDLSSILRCRRLSGRQCFHHVSLLFSIWRGVREGGSWENNIN